MLFPSRHEFLFVASLWSRLAKAALLLVGLAWACFHGLVSWAQTTPDTTPPTATITTPLSNAVITPPLTISGTASDTGTGGGAASGISRVDVQLLRSWGNAAGTPEYWTGAAWSATLTNLTTTLTGTQPNRNWNVSSPLPSGANLRPGQYRLSVRAFDGGNFGSPALTPYFYIGPQDTTAPTTTFTNPTLGASLSTTTGAATGVASDPVSTNGSAGSGVWKVSLQLYRTWTGVTEYWSGTAWSATNTVFPATLGTTNASNQVAWSGSIAWPTGANLPAGKYTLRASLSDRWGLGSVVDNNLVAGAADTTGPTVAITSPLANAQLSALPSITGTAADNSGGSGLGRVAVQLKRSVLVSGVAQTQCWNGPGGAWTTSTTYLPTSSEVGWTRNTSLPSGANLPLGSYTVTAQAVDRYNNASPVLTNAFSMVLLAPTGLTAAPGNAQIALSWTASSGATSYKVFRATSSGSYNFAAPVGTPTSPSFTNTGLTNGTTSFYVVRAVNASGESASSAEISATPVAPAPTGVTATTQSDTSISVAWTAVAGATSYRVDSSLNGTTWTQAATPTTNSVTLTGLTPFTLYSLRVLASNAGGNSLYSSVVTAKTKLQTPTLSGTAGNTSASLSWITITGATGYTVQRKLSTGSTYATVATPTGTSYSDTGLTNGSTYNYLVFATSGVAAEQSPNSNVVNVTPVAPTPTPTPPAALGAVGRNTKVDVSWPAVTGATSYKVFRSTTSGTFATTPTATVSSASYSDTGLTNGTTYYYVVRASNLGGDSANSPQASAVPRIPFVFTNITNGQNLSDAVTVNVSVNSPDIREYGDITLDVLNSSGQVLDSLKTSTEGMGIGRPSFFVLSTYYYPNGAATLRLSDGSGYQDSRSVIFDNDVSNFNRDGVFDVTSGGSGGVPTSATITATIKAGFSGWKVTISDLDSNIVKTFTGTGTSVNAVWDGTNVSGVQVPPQFYQLQVVPTTSGGSGSARFADNRIHAVNWNPQSFSGKKANFRLIQTGGATPKPILNWLNKSANSDVLVLLSRDVFPGGLPSLISYAKFIKGQLAIRQGITYYGPIQIFVTDARTVNASTAVRGRINSLLSARKVLVYVDAEGGELPYPYFAVGSYSWYSRNPPATPRAGITANFDVSALTAPLNYGNPDGSGGADPPTLVWMEHCRSLGDDGTAISLPWVGGGGDGSGPPQGSLANPWRWDWTIPFGIGNVTDTSYGGTLLGVGGTLHMYGAYSPPQDSWDQWRMNMWSRLFAGGKNFITSFNQTNSVTPYGAFPFPDNPQDKYNWYGDSTAAF